MRSTARGAAAPVGAKSCVSVTAWPFVSVSVKSGAFWPTCGASAEAGSARASTKIQIAPAEKNSASKTTTVPPTFAAMLRGYVKELLCAQGDEDQGDDAKDKANPRQRSLRGGIHEVDSVAQSRSDCDRQAEPERRIARRVDCFGHDAVSVAELLGAGFDLYPRATAGAIIRKCMPASRRRVSRVTYSANCR